jgi:hypothetical protein
MGCVEGDLKKPYHTHESYIANSDGCAADVTIESEFTIGSIRNLSGTVLNLAGPGPLSQKLHSRSTSLRINSADGFSPFCSACSLFVIVEDTPLVHGWISDLGWRIKHAFRTCLGWNTTRLGRLLKSLMAKSIRSKRWGCSWKRLP